MPTRTAAKPDPAIQTITALAAARVVIEAVSPSIDAGRFPVKRRVGDVLNVSADIFTDGHDKVAAMIRLRRVDEKAWQEAPITFFDNDRWTGEVPLDRPGRHVYEILAWVDRFASWQADTLKKLAASEPVDQDLAEGRALVQKAGLAAGPDDFLLSQDCADAMRLAAPRGPVSSSGEMPLMVDRKAGACGAWYELFPRSSSGDAAVHGTFADVIALLPMISGMGFDVLYLPPIHPIGRSYRKGRNNSLTAQPDEPGSPYAIGAAEGGHTAIHPQLGTLKDFRQLVAAANGAGLELALDFAVQCAPDHPWVTEHPEWFDWRPDGSLKYAENPPKKYQDIVNVDFYGEGLPPLWLALRDVVLFWIDQGVRIFRVDNPHTKPLPFWEWLIGDIQAAHPDIVFLAEAFTRPKLMRRLAKLGFTQSYTYFTWRHTKPELTAYFTELSQSECRDYLRPNLFPNTPDINPPFLQTGGRAAFIIRAVLAATLSSVYGIYCGFELCEAAAVPGTEEYLDSEKYQLRAWDWNRPGHIRDTITALNRSRREHPALQDYTNLRFYTARDDNILFYGKMTPARDHIILVAVNLDPFQAHGGMLELPLYELGLQDWDSVAVEDLLGGWRFTWTGRDQYIELKPGENPAMIWRVGRVGRVGV